MAKAWTISQGAESGKQFGTNGPWKPLKSLLPGDYFCGCSSVCLSGIDLFMKPCIILWIEHSILLFCLPSQEGMGDILFFPLRLSVGLSVLHKILSTLLEIFQQNFIHL